MGEGGDAMRRSVGHILARTGIRIPLVLWTIAVLYPIIWMFLGSFKSNAEIYRNPWGFPESFSMQNFVDAWSNFSINTSVFNSLIVTFVGAILTLALAIPTAYAIQRIKFRGSNILFIVYVSAMMILMVLGWIKFFFFLMKFSLFDNFFNLIFIYFFILLYYTILLLYMILI